MKVSTLKRRDLDSSDTLGSVVTRVDTVSLVVVEWSHRRPQAWSDEK
jgi:hypothetical protein